MSARMSLPLNQQRHNNISTVRLKVKGKRFEIACYKNKVLAYRSGEEKDFDNVVQVERIFTNVSQGQFANKKDLKEYFGDKTEPEILKYILDNGELQVAELERSAEQQKMWSTIATFVAEHCVHPITKRKYGVSIIESAMKDLGFAVKVDSPSKPQALQLIKELTEKQILPICRAPMRVRVCGPHGIEHSLPESGITIEKTEDASPTERSLDILMDTGLFRALEISVRKVPGATLFVLSQAVTAEGDGTVEDALVAPVVKAPEPPPVEDTTQTNNTTYNDMATGFMGRAAPQAEKIVQQALGKKAKKANATKGTSNKDNDKDIITPPSIAADLLAPHSLQNEDSDDDDKKKKGGKKVKKVNNPAVPLPPPQQTIKDEEEEFVSARKQMKKNKAKAKKECEPEPLIGMEEDDSCDYFYQTPMGEGQEGQASEN